MDQELKELTEQIRELIRTLQNTSSTGATRPADDNNQPLVRGVDRMVVALGQLAAKLDTTKKTRIAEEEAVKKFVNSVDKTTEQIEKEIAERKEATRNLKEEARIREEQNKKREEEEKQKRSKEAAEDIRRSAHDAASRFRSGNLFNTSLTRSSEEITKLGTDLNATGATAEVLKSSFGELTGAVTPTQIGLKVLGAGFTGAAKSLTQFSTDLLEGKRGPETTARALTNLVTPVLELASSFGTAALAIGSIAMLIPGFQGVGIAALAAGGALKGIAVSGDLVLKYNERAAKQLATLNDSYNQLSKSGIAVGEGIGGVQKLIHTLNLTDAEAAKFNELLTKSNDKLALMGGTAGQGAKRFGEVAGELARSGIGEKFEMMGITQDEMREASLLYMSIQARTGQLQLKNTQELVSGSAKFVEELDMAAKLTGKSRQEQQEAMEANMAEERFRAAMFMAEQRGDTKKIDELKKAGQLAGMLRTMGLTEQATGVQQYAASDGAAIGTSQNALNAMLQFGLDRTLGDPTISAVEALRASMENSKEMMQTFGDTITVIGSDQLGPFMKNVPKTLDGITRLAEAQKAATSKGLTLEQYLKTEQGQAALADKDLENLVKGNRAQLAATQILEKGILQLNFSAKLHKEGSEMFKDAVKEFGDILGIKTDTGAGAAGGTSTPGGAAGSAAVPAPSSTKSGTAAGAAAATTIDTKTAQAALAEATAKRVKIVEEKGPASPEAKAARLAEFKARRQAEVAGAAEMSARSRAAQETPLAGERPTSSATKILDLIGRVEGAGGNYNVLVGGKTNPELTSMTISEVLAFQNNMIAQGHESTAVGKYQIIQDTLKGLLRQGVVSPNETFSPSTQDKLATALLNEKGWTRFQSGKMSADQMADGIAKIWAAFPMANGQSYYQGKGSNKALLSRQEVLTALSDAPKARDGGMFTGPMTGYPAVLHGKEAVIPLKNGAVPVSLPSLDELVSSNRAVDAQVQVLRNEMGTMMRELTNAMMNIKDSGSQQRMIELLESISRHQQTTATASTRMAQLAAN